MAVIERITHDSVNPDTGTAYGKLTGSTALTVIPTRSGTGFILTLEPDAGAAGTVAVRPVPPGADPSRIGDPADNVATLGTHSGINGSLLDVGRLVLTPALTVADCGWHLAILGGEDR